MKYHNFHYFAIIFLLAFFITTSHSTSRNLASNGGEADENMNNIKSRECIVKIGKIGSFDMVMGVEEYCENEEEEEEEEEEWLKRRVIAEAHLDYIYTQHLLP